MGLVPGIKYPVFCTISISIAAIIIMKLRNYNIYFHTHTISGIIISLILYVIFFAGSFAFFKPEISSWQNNTPNNQVQKDQIDFNRILDTIGQDMNLYGRDISIFMKDRTRRMIVSVTPSKDSTVKGSGGYFYMDAKNYTNEDYTESYDLGEFLYRLHFLAPLNVIGPRGVPVGYYVAGGVAFIFLFAIITGVLVHWQKIVSNFYQFRPWEKLKTLWTDIHTALGVITLPFLFIFAVTGAYYLISYPLFTTPAAKYEYAGNMDSLFTATNPNMQTYTFQGKPLETQADLDYYFKDGQKQLKNAAVNSMVIHHYGDQSMHLQVSAANRKENFSGTSFVNYEVASGKIIEQRNIDESPSYGQTVDDLVYTLHFGSFGGTITRVLYFLLGIAGCIVIISGVMIWLVARDKKNIPEKKRRFNAWLANIYLSIATSMYPVTAAAFIAVKLHPDGGQSFIYSFYFWTWLAISLLLIIRKNNYKTNRDCLLSGSLIGIAIPVVNGFVTGNWIWNSWANHYYDILLIDVFWLITAICTFITWILIIKKQREKVQLTANT